MCVYEPTYVYYTYMYVRTYTRECIYMCRRPKIAFFTKFCNCYIYSLIFLFTKCHFRKNPSKISKQFTNLQFPEQSSVVALHTNTTLYTCLIMYAWGWLQQNMPQSNCVHRPSAKCVHEIVFSPSECVYIHIDTQPSLCIVQSAHYTCQQICYIIYINLINSTLDSLIDHILYTCIYVDLYLLQLL